MFNYGTGDPNPAKRSVVSTQVAPPKSDPGASFGNQNQEVDTSNIFNGSSRDKATSWRVHRGAGAAPNSAFAGKGAISFDENSTPQPFEIK